MVLVFVLSNWLRLEFTISRGLEKKLVLPAGLVSGFLNGMTNAAGPALAIYLYSLKLTKKEFIKSIAMIFIITKLSQLLAVSTWNLFNWMTLSLSLGVTLFVLLGFYGGLKIQDRINQQTFSRGLVTLIVRHWPHADLAGAHAASLEIFQPHIVCGSPNHKRQFSSLIFWRDAVAHDRRGETALRTETESSPAEHTGRLP